MKLKQITCFIPQGMLSIDVPIIVFHIANLCREKSKLIIKPMSSSKYEEKMTDADRTYMVIILGFLAACSLPPTLKAVPSGL